MTDIERKQNMKKLNEETKEKILAFFDPGNIEGLKIRAVVGLSLKEQLEKDFKFEVEQKNEQPIAILRGNVLQLAYAVVRLLEFDDNFYHNLMYVLAVREIEAFCGKGEVEFMHAGKSLEEIEVMKEAFFKSPEDLEKIKEQLKK